MYRGIKYMVLSALLCILSCTTEVDICMDNSHQHLAEVEISYDLADIPEATLPDSMIVVAYRVLRSWKCSYMAPCSQEASMGRYIYNKPYRDVADVENKAAATRNNVPQGGAETGERFYVKRGDYRFITFNNTLSDIVFENNAASNWFERDGVIDSVISNKAIELYYKGYNKKDEVLNKYGKSWLDFNPYTEYIARSNAPVYFQFSDMYNMEDGKKNRVTLDCEKKTQDFEIRFSIDRDSVIVEKIIAEVSGIPCGMNLVTGKLDFKKTYKTFFEVHDTGNTSELWEAFSTYSGEISVMGLVSSNSKELDTGPGILQLAIYTYTENNGRRKSKVFHVGINMYNTMRRYGYVLAGSDEKIVLEIERELNLRKDEIIEDEETDTTVDYWIIREDIHVDI